MTRLAMDYMRAAVAGALCVVGLGGVAQAQEIKVGYVSLDRILRDSEPARVGSKKLEAEFAKRDKELQDMRLRPSGLTRKAQP